MVRLFARPAVRQWNANALGRFSFQRGRGRNENRNRSPRRSRPDFEQRNVHPSESVSPQLLQSCLMDNGLSHSIQVGILTRRIKGVAKQMAGTAVAKDNTKIYHTWRTQPRDWALICRDPEGDHQTSIKTTECVPVSLTMYHLLRDMMCAETEQKWSQTTQISKKSASTGLLLNITVHTISLL